MRVLDDDRDPRIDDLPVDADTHNDVDLERAGQYRWRDLRELQLWYHDPSGCLLRQRLCQERPRRRGRTVAYRAEAVGGCPGFG